MAQTKKQELCPQWYPDTVRNLSPDRRLCRTDLLKSLPKGLKQEKVCKKAGMF